MIAKPIPAIYQKGHLLPLEDLDLPENSRIFFVLLDLSSNNTSMEETRTAIEKASFQDYSKFEMENNCVPSDEELNYYLILAALERR